MIDLYISESELKAELSAFNSAEAIEIEVEQNSEKWLNLRAGKLTGSAACFLPDHKNLVEPKTAKGKEAKPKISDTSLTYLFKRAAEIITGETEESFTNKYTEYGTIKEPEAITEYIGENFDMIASDRSAGFIEKGSFVGCSLDYIINSTLNYTYFLEVKSPYNRENYLKYCFENSDTVSGSKNKNIKNYYRQCLFNYVVSGLPAKLVFYNEYFSPKLHIIELNFSAEEVESMKKDICAAIIILKRIIKQYETISNKG